ncbi:MAG: hypothetical protein JNG83_06270 [Opitutaceae bacterium]|nr:hypothetical protein [Opitutaceae bacterium]
MNRKLTSLMLMVGVLVFTIKTAASDRWETLRAINWVENPTNHSQAGRFGELGPYQFRSSTWKMHTSRPFSQAVQRAAADEVAVKHYEWIRKNLANAGIDPSPFNIALAWNCGVNAVMAGRAPNVSYDYAERVSNIVERLKERAPVVSEEPAKPVVPSQPERWDIYGDELYFRVLRDPPRFVIATG